MTKLCAALACCLVAAAQDPRFGVESRLVMVPVTVTDAKGRTVDALEAADFRILDNGIPQRAIVDSFATGVAPIALVVAVQSSGISVPALEKVQKVGSMIQALITGERGCAALLSFDENVTWRQECTSDPEKLARAFYGLEAGGYRSARMLDAVGEGVRKLKRHPKARRVLLLISESRDRGSESELETVLMEAQAAGVTVYAASYSAYATAFTTRAARRDKTEESPIPRANRTEPLSPKGRVPIPAPDQRVDILGGIGELVRLGKVKDTEALTSKTGGAAFSFARLKGLEEAIARLGAELHSQYVLSFTPENPAPGYHRLDVEVARPGPLRIRARPGYWWAQ